MAIFQTVNSSRESSMVVSEQILDMNVLVVLDYFFIGCTPDKSVS